MLFRKDTVHKQQNSARSHNLRSELTYHTLSPSFGAKQSTLVQILRTGITMMQSTTDCLRYDPPARWLGFMEIRVIRYALLNALMWSCLIVVSRVSLNHSLQMLTVMDEHMIQAFSSQAAHEPFTYSISLWHTIRCFQFFDARSRSHC